MQQELLHYNNKTFIPYIDSGKIISNIDSMALQINKDYAETEIYVLAVLNGAFMFTSDLLKRIHKNVIVNFVKLSSYSGSESTGEVKNILGLPDDIHGRNILILEDIIDTGLTIKSLLNQLEIMGAKKTKVASLFYKPSSSKTGYIPDYIGMEIGDDFIIGYGLDYNGYGRNLESIYKLR